MSNTYNNLPEDCAARWIVPAWAKRANALAAHFGSPLYLVGSALEKANPADIDIRVPMQEHDMQRFFGDDGPADSDSMCTRRELALWRECLKQSRRWSRATGGRNVDFQIQTVKTFDSYILNADRRIRLDRLPDDFFSAGLGDP